MYVVVFIVHSSLLVEDQAVADPELRGRYQHDYDE
jgi:hypothetical protein